MVTEVENGLELLMPHPDNFFIGTTESTSTLQTDSTETSQVINKSKTPLDKIILVESNNSQKGPDDAILKGEPDEVSDPKEAGLDQNSTKCNENKILQSGLSHENENQSNNINKHADSATCNVYNGERITNLETFDDKNMKTMQMFGHGDSNNDGRSSDNEEELDNDDSDEEDFAENLRGGVFTQEHGIMSHTFEITVDMGAEERGLKVTDDNADIVQDVREKYKLIKSKYLSYVKRWIQVT